MPGGPPALVSRGAASVRAVLHWLARGALLAAWALVGWGTLLLLVTLANTAERGPRAALGVLLPAAGATVWDLVSAFSAVLALVCWLMIAGMLVLARWPPRDLGGRSPDGTAEPAGAEDPGGDGPAPGE